MWRDLNTFEGLWEITRKEGDFKNNSEGIDGAWALKEKNNDTPINFIFIKISFHHLCPPV